MNDQPQKPPELKVLCIAFLLWSVLSVAAHGLQWTTDSGPSQTIHTLTLDLGTLGFIASIGLWRLSPAGRIFALVLTWYWLIGAVLLFLQVFPIGRITVTFPSAFLTIAPKALLRVLVVPFFLAQLWQYRALTRPGFVELFRSTRKEAIAPPATAANGPGGA